MKTDIRDVLFWLLLTFTLLFIILRITGVINSPEWIDLVPLATIVFAAGIAYQKLIGSIDRVYLRTGYLKSKIDLIENKVNSNDARISVLDKGFVSLEKGQEMILDILKKK